MRLPLLALASLSITTTACAQQENSTPLTKQVADSIHPGATEKKKVPAKVLHAEPLYIDLIRDLGARKGEREWNFGMGLADNNRFDRYTALVEYEFAPADRLGVEIEVPFTFYYPNSRLDNNQSTPASKLNSLKLATQYSFFVSEKMNTSLALGYIHEFELVDFHRYGKESIYAGNAYNPFFVAAKRWGNHFHSLVYAGPYLLKHFHEHELQTSWQVNTSFHYMIPGTRNFIGVEFNKEKKKGDFDMTIRPQLRLEITNNLLIGIVTGIPISRENERFSSFLRLIYEPKHKV